MCGLGSKRKGGRAARPGEEERNIDFISTAYHQNRLTAPHTTQPSHAHLDLVCEGTFPSFPQVLHPRRPRGGRAVDDLPSPG